MKLEANGDFEVQRYPFHLKRIRWTIELNETLQRLRVISTQNNDDAMF